MTCLGFAWIAAVPEETSKGLCLGYRDLGSVETQTVLLHRVATVWTIRGLHADTARQCRGRV